MRSEMMRCRAFMCARQQPSSPGFLAWSHVGGAAFMGMSSPATPGSQSTLKPVSDEVSVTLSFLSVRDGKTMPNTRWNPRVLFTSSVDDALLLLSRSGSAVGLVWDNRAG